MGKYGGLCICSLDCSRGGPGSGEREASGGGEWEIGVSYKVIRAGVGSVGAQGFLSAGWLLV